MANRQKHAFSETVSASTTLSLGDASFETVSTWAIQVEATGFTGTIDIQGRIFGSTLTFQNIDYVDRADGTVKSAQLTGGFMAKVDATGLEIQLDIAVSAGSLEVVAHPVLG